jgi:hypothetical protein
MLGTKPESTRFAEQLMYLSGGLAIAVGLFSWVTTPATVYLLAVELGVGALWLGATRVLRSGRLPAIVAATVLCVVSIPVTATLILLTILLVQTNAGFIVILCDLFRLLPPVPIIVLLWTPGSRRYFRYVREGGEIEPRPRWSLGRMFQEYSPPRAEGPVTDEDVRLLRDYLQAGGQAEYPDSGLAAAALAEAAVRRLDRRATKSQVADYVAEALARPGVPSQDVWPRAAQELLLAALHGRTARRIDPRVRRATSGVLLKALAPTGQENVAAVEEFLAAARREEFLAAARRRADLRPR